MQVKFFKKSKYAAKGPLVKAAKGALAAVVVLMDDQTAVCTVLGEDADDRVAAQLSLAVAQAARLAS